MRWHPHRGFSVSRLAHHHGTGAPAAAARAPEPHPDQRHVTAPLRSGLQVRVRGVVTVRSDVGLFRSRCATTKWSGGRAWIRAVKAAAGAQLVGKTCRALRQFFRWV